MGRSDLSVALFEPELASNFGAMLRLCACLGVDVEVIEPCGFPLDDRRIRRAGMDYVDHVRYRRHADWARFRAWRATAERRLVLLTSRGDVAHHRFAFRPADILLFGRETCGVPDEVRRQVDAAVRVPVRPGVRCLNLVTAAAIALGEAFRQLGEWDGGS